jgi:hypothetical protein
LGVWVGALLFGWVFGFGPPDATPDARARPNTDDRVRTLLGARLANPDTLRTTEHLRNCPSWSDALP